MAFSAQWRPTFCTPHAVAGVHAAAVCGTHPEVMPEDCSAAENLKTDVSKPCAALKRICEPRREASKKTSPVVGWVFQIAVVCGACSVSAKGTTTGSPAMRERFEAMSDARAALMTPRA
jgi:hypothetical protein